MDFEKELKKLPFQFTERGHFEAVLELAERYSNESRIKENESLYELSSLHEIGRVSLAIKGRIESLTKPSSSEH